jgi:hypothetical protein
VEESEGSEKEEKIIATSKFARSKLEWPNEKDNFKFKSSG